MTVRMPFGREVERRGRRVEGQSEQAKPRPALSTASANMSIRRSSRSSRACEPATASARSSLTCSTLSADASGAPDQPDTDDRAARQDRGWSAPAGQPVASTAAPRGFQLRRPASASCSDDAELVQPPHDVAPAIETRQPRVTADRDRHLSARPLDFLGKLHAGRRGADDQHAALRQFGGIAVCLSASPDGSTLEVAAPSRAPAVHRNAQWRSPRIAHATTPRSLSTR